MNNTNYRQYIPKKVIRREKYLQKSLHFIDKNIIHVDDIDGNDTFFKLDDLNRSWHISAINNQEIIVENLNESNITFDKIFITTNVDTEIENLDKVVPHESYLIDYDRDLKSTITWQLDPDMNNECIKSMGLSINNITASIEWTVDDGEKSDEGVIEFNESSNGEWYFESNVEFSKDGSVCPSLIEINFDTKKIIVS